MMTTVTNPGRQPEAENSFAQATPASTANRPHPYNTTYTTPPVLPTTALRMRRQTSTEEEADDT
jgi:hypothetical protein